MRRIRADLVRQMAGVDAIGEIPFGIVPQIHAHAAALLGDPKWFPFDGLGCGGDQPDQSLGFDQETLIGHYE